MDLNELVLQALEQAGIPLQTNNAMERITTITNKEGWRR